MDCSEFSICWAVRGERGRAEKSGRRAGVTEKEQMGKIGWEKRGKSRKLEAVVIAHQMAGRAAIGRKRRICYKFGAFLRSTKRAFH